MKVGDYVRTKSGYVRKIIAIYNGYVEVDDKCFNSYANVQIENDVIKKSSPNIIDLIEVGDYVNGKRVEWIGYDLYQENEDKTLTGIGEKRILFNEFTKDSVREKAIKSIATHEQFSQMEYKVGE